MVSSKDIADILYRDMAPSRTTDTNSFEIQPYCQEESDTLLFIVNFKNGGWASQWGSDPINDGWYTLTGSWTVTNGGTYDYNHYRYMIYGFSVS